MDDEASGIIKASTFIVEAGRYVYTKVSELPPSKNHFMVSRDADETTVVTREENLHELKLIERNKDSYCLIDLNVSVPFYSVGFLATVSRAIADAGMDILIISTYSKDYVLVKDDKLTDARSALLRLGFQELT